MSTKLSWTEVDADSLPKGLAKQLTELREARQVARSLAQRFDEEFVKLLTTKAGNPPTGHQYVVGHNFGKLSFAIAETATKPSGGKAKFKL